MIAFGLFGLAFGSFAAMAIARLRAGESLRGRSHCDACRRELRPYELVPILSYAALRGRCPRCRAAINPASSIIEAASCAVFATAGWFAAPALAAAIGIAFVLAIIAAGVLVGRGRVPA